MYEIKLQKDRLRAQYLERRAALDPTEKAALDARLCERFMSLVTYRYCDALLLFAPKAQEIDITPIAQAALEAGKRVAFPRCDPPGSSRAHTMRFHTVTALDQLTPGAYGIMEPDESLPLYLTPDTSKAVIIVPALVYDRHGYRLGYGGGYYDRFLSGFGGARVGLCYSQFVCGRLPRSRYDISVDVLVTEKSVAAIRRQS